MEILKLAQVRERAREVRAEFEALMQSRTLAIRKTARQWQFFQLCFESTLGGSPANWPDERPQQLAQFKFEVEDKLRQHYQRATRPVRYLFSLIHRSNAIKDRLISEPDYPGVAGYCMLVRDGGERRAGMEPVFAADQKAWLERVVTASIDAEFAAYCALPRIEDEAMLAWIRRDSGFHVELLRVLSEARRNSLVLSNDFNPSTRRLIAVSVKQVDDREAVLQTKEYWYLRWWSETSRTYVRREQYTQRRVYRLAKTPAGWRVFDRTRERRGAQRRLLWDGE